MSNAEGFVMNKNCTNIIEILCACIYGGVFKKIQDRALTKLDPELSFY